MKRYGKVLLSAYLIKKINSMELGKSRGAIKYGKLILGAYLLDKIKSEKFRKELEPEALLEPEKVESAESGGGSSMKLVKILMGALVGATAIYALKKHSTKKRRHKIAVE